MFGWRPNSTSLGEMIHIAQSLVGKVLSNSAITPPTPVLFSTTCTLNPESAKSRAACIPAIPPPTTRTEPFLLDGLSFIPISFSLSLGHHFTIVFCNQAKNYNLNQYYSISDILNLKFLKSIFYENNSVLLKN